MCRPPTIRSARTWLLLLPLVTLATVCRAQQVTNGPLAIVSLGNEMAYKTGRSCAVGCLVYNGNIPCAAGAFYRDIGVWLGCERCRQINACYCSADLASSATSMIDSCVSKRCSEAGIADWDQEVTKMLALYDGYCATANVEATTASRVRPAATTAGPNPTPGTGAGTGSNSEGEPAVTNRPTASGTGTTSPDADKKNGLSQSDIVALAASLGVGIPSLLIAAITLCVQLKKRKRRQRSEDGRILIGLVPASGTHLPSVSHTSAPVPQGQGWNVPGPYRGQPDGGAHSSSPARASVLGF